MLGLFHCIRLLAPRARPVMALETRMVRRAPGLLQVALDTWWAVRVGA